MFAKAVHQSSPCFTNVDLLTEYLEAKNYVYEIYIIVLANCEFAIPASMLLFLMQYCNDASKDGLRY